MKAVIFAGGVGTRLWPLSRKKSPKQFEKVVGDKSTLQLAAERLMPEFGAKDIYISTGIAYFDVVCEQLSFVPKENIILEPAKKDVGPAVALIMGYLAQKFSEEPVVILWSDHLVGKIDLFKKLVLASGKFIKQNSNKIIFIGQKARYPSENLGWIETGGKIAEIEGIALKSFERFKYRPGKDEAQKYFNEENYCWNLGYFVTSPNFIYSLFKKHSPNIHKVIEHILNYSSQDEFQSNLEKYYKVVPEVSFDAAVLEKMEKSMALVVVEDIGWSDIGAWEALKEALERHHEDNITKGRVLLEESKDSLVYNYQSNKLIVGVDINDMLVVNTEDVLLVARKSAVSQIKKIVEGFQGTENEKLT